MLPAGIIPDLRRSQHSGGGALIVFQEPPEPCATLHRTLTRRVWADRRKEQPIPLALMIPLVVIMLHVVRQRMAERRFPKENHP